MNHALLDELEDLVEQKRYREVKDRLSDMNVVDIAELFETIDDENIVRIFRMIPKEKASEVFVYLDGDKRENLIGAITDPELSTIMDDLFLDDTVDILEELPATMVKKILKNTTASRRALINQFLKYHEDSAGSLMTIEFIDLKKEMTVSQAIDYIRRNGTRKETIYTCYVTDRNRFLEGVLTVEDLLLARPEELVADIMDTNIIFCHTTDDKEEVAQECNKYDLLSIPVVDMEKRLVGIITIDDIMDVVADATREDFEVMAAVHPSEQPYLKTSVFSHYKNRIVWLLFLMLSATLTGSIITQFETALAAVPILTASIPMLMDTGGNAGSQTSILIIRGMALGEIHPKDIMVALWKELRISFLVGITLAVVNFGRIYLMQHNAILALTVSLSLWGTVMLAKCVGCLLPIGAKKLGLDPALMASPIITTVVDACSLLLYFNIAKLILGI